MGGYEGKQDGISALLLPKSIIGVIYCAGIFSSSVVTLQSIQIFKSHEWLAREPTIYFLCQGENKTFLPDVKKTYFLYTFKGAESWQVCSFNALHYVHILNLTIFFFLVWIKLHAFNNLFSYTVGWLTVECRKSFCEWISMEFILACTRQILPCLRCKWTVHWSPTPIKKWLDLLQIF